MDILPGVSLLDQLSVSALLNLNLVFGYVLGYDGVAAGFRLVLLSHGKPLKLLKAIVEKIDGICYHLSVVRFEDHADQCHAVFLGGCNQGILGRVCMAGLAGESTFIIRRIAAD